MAVKTKDTSPKMWKTQRLNPSVRLSKGERAKLITAQRAFSHSIDASRLNMGLVLYLFLFLCHF